MGHDRHQLIFGIHRSDQAGVKEDQTGWRGEGVELTLVYDKKSIVEILDSGDFQHLTAQFIDILDDIRLFNQFKSGSY